MKQSLFILTIVSLSLGLAYYTWSHPSLAERARLERELDELRGQNTRLAGENTRLEAQIVALRDDPRLAERRARETASLARPDELIFQFEQPREQRAIQVKLEVAPDHLKLAGRPVTQRELTAAVAELRAQLPEATIKLELHADIPPAERARYEAIIAPPVEHAEPIPTTEDAP
jgi:cell division protein FtsB